MSNLITQGFEFTTCAKCGFEFAIPSSFLERRRGDGKQFYCPSSGGTDDNWNVHSMSFRQPKKIETIIKDIIREVPIEVFIEKEHEPKNFKEMLESHEHDFSKKNRGGLSCKICGLYKAAYQELTGKI